MLSVKYIALKLIEFFGPWVPTTYVRQLYCSRVVPRVLDKRILPRIARPRELRRFDNTTILCNPYIYTHRSSYWCGVLYEEAVEKYIIREVHAGDSVIDIGCNYGHIAVPAAICVGRYGCVHAYEANPELVKQLKEHVDGIGLHQIVIYPYGLGDSEGKFQLLYDLKRPGGGTMRENDIEGMCQSDDVAQVECEVRVGDQVMQGLELPGRTLMKVDVEGYEIKVLSGLKQTLSHSVDHLLVEVSPQWIGGQEGVQAIFSIVKDAGMVPHELKRNGRVGRELNPKDIAEQVNVICVRPSQ